MTNSEILKTINFLLDNNENVYWKSSLYDVVRDTDGTLLVVCNENGFTSGLGNCDLKDCGTHKWAIRENNLVNFKLIR
mgnify:CR=1 FL=1|tara:strand:+ start:556 stop:789 length:234 start_codon:yes stop_codon:yes gene_type:complete